MFSAKKIAIGIASVLLVAICVMPAQAAAKKQIALRLGHEMPEGHPYHMGALKFAEILEKKSNGAMKVQIFANGTLGKQAQLVESLAMGTVDLCLTNTPVLEKYEPRMAVLAMPYVARDWDHQYRVVDGEIGAELNKGLEKHGVTVLAYHEIGVNNINATFPVKVPADMKGKKFRVVPGPCFVEIGKALDSVVVTTAFSEVYTALQLGTIDAQTSSGSNILLAKHYEIAKHFIFCNLGLFLEPLSMSKMVFDRLSPEQQKMVKEAAQESAIWQRAYARENQEKDLAECEKRGLNVYRPTPEEQQLWKDAIEPVHAKFPEWLDLINKIKAMP